MCRRGLDNMQLGESFRYAALQCAQMPEISITGVLRYEARRRAKRF